MSSGPTGNEKFAYKHPLWRKLEREVLPFVNRPGRYVGNELNAVIKTQTGLFRVALAFPDMYEVGASYLGQQILYNIINAREDCSAERVFQVWPDMKERLLQKQLPLFSLESTTPLKDFDLIGFSVTYEMHAPGILDMLEMAGIPLKATDRDDHYPLIVAGGPAVLNPEPLAEFFDAVFLGDGEDAITEIIDILIATRGVSKDHKLRALADVPGIYIPQFYEPVYEGGEFKRLVPIDNSIPGKIKIRSCAELEQSSYPTKPIVPFVETAHDRLSIEIMRGCSRGCRFCQAGFQYRPRRHRKSAEIFGQIERSIPTTGYDEVTLLSLSSTDYPGLESLVEEMMPYFSRNRLSLSLPSLRPGSLSQKMLGFMQSQRHGGITLAPEAGTKRLRDVLGKNISEQEILDAVRLVFQNDWPLVKLYFMIGLPTETGEDIDGIIDLIHKISGLARGFGGKRNINVTISPFCPKPGTPWQWETQAKPDYIKSIYDRLANSLRMRNVALKFRDPYLSMIEGILGRGDRRLSGIIIAAHQDGARLDGWSEYFSSQRWLNAFQTNGIKAFDMLDAKDPGKTLPWDHIDKGISSKFLLAERERSLLGELPPGSIAQTDNSFQQDGGAFGRSPKKRPAHQATPIRTEVRLKYRRDERLRFYSHLDIMRAFQRAIRRAGLPVDFSEGYHPHMKLSFGPPLPLGYISQSEYLDIQLENPLEKNHLLNLNENMPPGLEIIASKLMLAKGESLVKIINAISYNVEIADLADGLPKKIADLLISRQIDVIRKKGVETRQFAAGEFLYEFVLNGTKLEMLLGIGTEAYVRPAEILTFGLGFSEEMVLALVYNRTGQYHIQGIHKVDPLDLV